MVRCIGCAAIGAVDVLGGGEKGLVPLEPKLLPPPTPASADADGPGDAMGALRESHSYSLWFPGRGNASLTWSRSPKCEATIATRGCGPPSRVGRGAHDDDRPLRREATMACPGEVASGSQGRTVVRRQGHAATLESTAFP